MRKFYSIIFIIFTSIILVSCKSNFFPQIRGEKVDYTLEEMIDLESSLEFPTSYVAKTVKTSNSYFTNFQEDVPRVSESYTAKVQQTEYSSYSANNNGSLQTYNNFKSLIDYSGNKHKFEYSLFVDKNKQHYLDIKTDLSQNDDRYLYLETNNGKYRYDNKNSIINQKIGTFPKGIVIQDLILFNYSQLFEIDSNLVSFYVKEEYLIVEINIDSENLSKEKLENIFQSYHYDRIYSFNFDKFKYKKVIVYKNNVLEEYGFKFSMNSKTENSEMGLTVSLYHTNIGVKMPRLENKENYLEIEDYFEIFIV